MVDIGDKPLTKRIATAVAYIRMEASTLALIQEQGLPKGDVLAVARIAGLQAAKNTSNLIPLCHPLMLSKVEVSFSFDTDKHLVIIHTTCALSGKTGVEMEALTAASVAALTIYDMCKAVDKGMVIEKVGLLEKQGGKSGPWKATGDI